MMYRKIFQYCALSTNSNLILCPMTVNALCMYAVLIKTVTITYIFFKYCHYKNSYNDEIVCTLDDSEVFPKSVQKV